LLAGALAAAIAFLVVLVLVTWHRLDGADRVVRALVHGSPHSLLRSPMETASFLGGEPGQVVVMAIACALLWRTRRRWSLALPAVMAGAGVLQFAAKWMVDRPRPNLDPLGFPSAHVLSLVVLGGYLAFVAGTSDARRGWRRLGGAAWAALVVATVAYSRIYLDAHWFSDVLGGFAIGLAYLLAVIWVISSQPSMLQWSGTRALALEGVAEGHVGEPRLLAAEADVDPRDERLA